MLKFLRNSALSRNPVRLPRSSLRYNGQIRIQQVRFVRPFFTRKHAHRYARYLLIGIFVIGTVFALPQSDDEGEHQRNAGSKVETMAQEASEKHQKATGKYVSAEEDLKSVTARREGLSANGGSNEQGKAKGENGILKDRRDEKEQRKGETGYEEEEGEEEEEEEEDFEAEEEEVEEDEDSMAQPVPENAMFIPLSSVRKRQPPYYKGSGPEWQSFLELAKEPKRLHQIRYELAGMIGAAAATTQYFKKRLGVPIMGSRYWLEIEFPDRPPPVYERSGLEFTADDIAWTTRPISTWEYSRLKAVLWPKPMAAALWTSYRTWWSLSLAKMKDYLTIKSKQENANPNPQAKFFGRWISNRKQESQPSPGVDRSDSSKDAPVGESSKSSAKTVASNFTGALSPLLTLLEPGEDMKIVYKAFRRRLLKEWKFPETPLEPGTCLVTGIVELVGPKAVCSLDIQAFYNPRESRWTSIRIAVRRLQDRKQQPKR